MSAFADSLLRGALGNQERAAVNLLLSVPATFGEVVDRPDVRAHIIDVTAPGAAEPIAVVSWSNLSLALTDNAVSITARQRALIRIACSIGSGARVSLHDALRELHLADVALVVEAIARAGGLEPQPPIETVVERDLSVPCGTPLPEGVVGYCFTGRAAR